MSLFSQNWANRTNGGENRENTKGGQIYLFAVNEKLEVLLINLKDYEHVTFRQIVLVKDVEKWLLYPVSNQICRPSTYLDHFTRQRAGQ